MNESRPDVTLHSDRGMPCRASWVALAWVLLSSLPAAAQLPLTPTVKPGFPIELPGQGSVAFTYPVAADLGLSVDGTRSIVFGTVQGELWVIRKAANGTWGVAPGFPVQVGTYVGSSPAIGELTGDGGPEIVVGHGDPATAGPGGVKAFRADGSLLWQRASRDTLPGQGPDPVLGTPAIGDLDNDGWNEVAWGSFDHHLYVVDGRTGADKSGWPKNMRDTIWSSPALHDITGDGRLDIVIGRDSHEEGSPVNTPDGGCLHVFEGNGAAVAGFPYTTPLSPSGLTPKCIGQTIQSAPSIGDIDGDGKPEIVHGTGNFYTSPSHSPPEKLYAWNCDGTPVTGWPVSIVGQSRSSPVLVNLDNDPELEVVTTADNTLSSGTFRLYGFDGDGGKLFESIPKDFFGVTLSAQSPVVGDMLGPDAEPEILVPSNSSVVVFSKTGAQLTDDGTHAPGALSFLAGGSLTGTAVIDLESDGSKIEVLAIAGTSASGGSDTRINVWNPVSRSSLPDWPFYRKDEARRGAEDFLPDQCLTARVVELSNVTLNAPMEYEACRVLEVGPDVEVTSSGGVTFRSGQTIVLRSGFSVVSGASFTAVIDPSVSASLGSCP